MNMRVLVLSTLCAATRSACGSDSPPSDPTLQLPFATSTTNRVQFNDVQGVLVGTSGFLTFAATNIGTQTLTVTEVTYSGPLAIALSPGTNEPLPASVPYNDELLIGLTCTPPAAQTYEGTVEIKSNAVNTPDQLVYLSCVGK
jgi:hypothetical protein